MSTNTEPTIGALLDRFCTDSLPSRAPSTQREYRRHIEVLRQHFGDRIAADMRPKDFGPFLERPGRGLANRVRTITVLSTVFTDAVRRWYCLPTNVLRDVHKPKFRPRDRLILDEEFEGCKAVAFERMRLAMDLALLTGQRQGDIIRFKWSDIRGMELHVYQSKTRKRIGIAIGPRLERVLDRCWQLHGDSEYVLPNKHGRPYTSQGLRAGWQKTQRKWIKRGGAPFHFHDIRALAATKCPTPEVAMRLLGHQNMSMTLRVYRRGVEHVQSLE